MRPEWDRRRDRARRPYPVTMDPIGEAAPDVRARVRAVVAILVTNAFGTLGDLVRRRRGERLARRFRRMLEALGPTFIKLGQVLSTRPDILPDVVATELALLQDHAPIVRFAEIRTAVEAGLCATLEERYREFDPVPLAAASIGQVHAALLPDGTAVVVKVRRPEVRRTIDVDLRILERGARLLGRVSRLARRYDVVGLADRFATTLRLECDYVQEGRNAEVIAAALASVPNVVVPAIDWARTTDGVLTEMRVAGAKVDDIVTLDQMGVDRGAVAVTFADAYLTMVFGNGFFHADPHPGNVFVDEDATVSFVDFGMTGQVDPVTERALGGVLLSIVAADRVRMADSLLGLGMATRSVDRVRLEADLGHLLDRYAHRSLEEMPVAEVLGKVMGIVRRHRLTLPPDLALLVKTVMMCEGVALRLDPGFLLVPRLLPFASRIVGGDEAPDA